MISEKKSCLFFIDMKLLDFKLHCVKKIVVFYEFDKRTRRRCNSHLCYISQLVHTICLVNLAGRTLLYGPLKFKDVLLPNYSMNYHQDSGLNF